MNRTTRLCVETLEPRDVPAGAVSAAVVNGVLVLTGDENNNWLTFQISPTGVTVTPFGGTSVNGQPADTPVALPGATGLKADLGDGDDTLNLAGTSDLLLSKGAKISLGDGFNNLNLITTGTIDLASLSVVGTDGRDQVTVRGGAGNPNRIAGPATFNPGDGGGFTILENVSLPGAAGLKVTAGTGADDLTLNNVTVAKALTAALGQGEGNNVRVTGGRIGSLVATSFGGNLNLTNTTVAGNALFTTVGATDSDITGTTVGGTLRFKTTQGFYGGGIVRFFGTGSLGGLAFDAAQDALVTFKVASAYTVARDVSEAGRNGYGQLILDGGTVAARHVAVTSRESNPALVVSNAGRLELNGNATVTALSGHAGLTVAGGATFTARDVSLTSREGSAGMAVYDAGRLVLGGKLTLIGPRQAGATLATGGVVEIARDVKVAAAGTANIQVSDANLSARHVTLTSTGGLAFVNQFGASTIDLAGRLTVTGRTRADFTQTNGASMTVSGDLSVTSRDDARFTQVNANTTLAIGGSWKVRSDFGLAKVSVKGQSLSVEGGTTLDGGYNSITEIATTNLSTLTAPVTVTGGFRISKASNAQKAETEDKFFNDSTTVREDDARLRGAVVGIAFAEGFKYGGLKDKQTTRGTGSGLPANIQIGSPGRPVIIDGDLRIQTGGARDTVTLRDLTVGGTMVILTGAGSDTLTIDNSTFTGAFGADLATGADRIDIAQAAGSAAPVTFTGKVLINAGDGADRLTLGRGAGDANSKAVFVAAGSRIDAGSGNDLFDDELGQFEGLVLGTGIVGWDDPTA